MQTTNLMNGNEYDTETYCLNDRNGSGARDSIPTDFYLRLTMKLWVDAKKLAVLVGKK